MDRRGFLRGLLGAATAATFPAAFAAVPKAPLVEGPVASIASLSETKWAAPSGGVVCVLNFVLLDPDGIPIARIPHTFDVEQRPGAVALVARQPDVRFEAQRMVTIAAIKADIGEVLTQAPSDYLVDVMQGNMANWYPRGLVLMPSDTLTIDFFKDGEVLRLTA